jgi:hypothetical protein
VPYKSSPTKNGKTVVDLIAGTKEDEEGPGFTYSVGLFHSSGHPEILAIGLEVDVMFRTVNFIGGAVRGWKVFEQLDESNNVLCEFIAGAKSDCPKRLSHAVSGPGTHRSFHSRDYDVSPAMARANCGQFYAETSYRALDSSARLALLLKYVM